MGWIKRNLFFVIGGGVALVLLGGAGYYIYQGWSRNSAAAVKLGETYETLVRLAQEKPYPGDEKVNNTQIAKEQERQVHDWVKQAREGYRSLPAIPPGGSVTSEAYAAALRRTIDQLQHEADGASVTLPPKYDFSFTAQRPLVKFAAGSLNSLAAQLGEVKAMSEILFAARINALDSFQRVRVSDDDATGPQSDYLDERPQTNALAILTPYVVTFRCFTPELARVISGFASSSNAFIVKSLNIQPAGAAETGDQTAGMPGVPGGTLPGMPMPGRYGREMMPPPTAVPQPAAQPAAGRGGLPVVLKEQLLRVTLEVELVKLLPKS
jgi:hypothetical protein